MTTAPEPRELVSEADFLAAEQEIASARTEREALYVAMWPLYGDDGRGNDKTAEIEARIEPVTDRIFAVYDAIAGSVPPTMTAAMIKLRHVVDEGLGLDKGSESDCVRQVLVFLEAQSAVDRDADGELLALLAERARLIVRAEARAVEDSIDDIIFEVAEIDQKVVDMIPSTVAAVVGLVDLLHYLTSDDNGPFCAYAVGHEDDCIDRLVVSIKVGVQRLAGKREGDAS